MSTRRQRNIIKRATLVRSITEEWHDPSRADRSLTWVWRQKINPVYPMSMDTYRRYLRIAGYEKL